MDLLSNLIDSVLDTPRKIVKKGIELPGDIAEAIEDELDDLFED